MDTDTHCGLKQLIKVAILSATFFMLGTIALATSVNADSSTPDSSNVPPAVYNGKSQQKQLVTNVTSDGQSQPNQYFTSWFSLDGQDSNYTGPTTKDNPSSILNLENYTKNPSSLYEHLLIKNDSDKPMTFSVEFCLPQFWRGKPSINTNWPIYGGGDKIVNPTSDSTAQGVDVSYIPYDKPGVPAANVKPTDLQDLVAITIKGTLNKNAHYQLDVPLKLTDPENMNLDNGNTTFDSITINNIANGYYHNHVRFARGVNAYKQLGINGTNKYAVTYRTYAWIYMNKRTDAGSTSGGNWGNMDGITNYGMQIVKVIDVNGINDQDQLFLKPGAKWNPLDKNNVTFWDPQQTAQVRAMPDAKPSVTSTRPLNADGTLNTSQTGSFDVTYSVPFEYANGNQVTFKKTIHVFVNNGSTSGGTATTPTTSTSSSGNNTTTGSSSTASSSSSSTPTTTTKPSTSVGPNIAVKGEAVYATKKIGLYKSTSFTKRKRIAWYPKQKRVNRPMFVVTGYKRNSNGTLRYKVRDVNHGRKTAGKTGYITASRKYVVPVYYASVPKSKKITVISPKGVNAYKSANLTGKTKHYKKGTHLRVKKLVKHNLTTRYQLSNGKYITANKKLIIAGSY